METKKSRRSNYKLALVSLLPVAFPDDFPIIQGDVAKLWETVKTIFVRYGGLSASVTEQMIQDPTVQMIWLQALSHWSVGLDPPQNFNMFKNIGHTLLKSIFVDYIISYKGQELHSGKGQTFLTKLSMYVLSNDLFQTATDFYNLTPYIRYRNLPYEVLYKQYEVSVGIDMKIDVFEAVIAAIVFSVDGCIMQGLGEAVAYNILFAYFDSVKAQFPDRMEDMEEPDTALLNLFKQKFKLEIFKAPYFSVSESNNLFRGTLKVDFAKDLNIIDQQLPRGCCSFTSNPYNDKSDVKKELSKPLLCKLKEKGIMLQYKDKQPWKPYVDPAHKVQNFGETDTKKFMTFIENFLVKRGGWNETPERMQHILQQTQQVWIDAFTHKSYNTTKNYEFYEKVGDVRVECAIFLYIYRRFVHLRDDHLGTGKFTEIVQHIKEKQNFARLAEICGFVPYIRYRNELDESDENGVKVVYEVDCDQSMKEDVFEAFCGAIGSALDPYYTKGFAQSLLYNIMSSILDNEPLTADINKNKDKVTKLKESFSDLFMSSGDPAFEGTVKYSEQIKPGQKYKRGTVRTFCNIQLGWLLIENAKGGNFNLYPYWPHFEKKNQGIEEMQRLATDVLKKRGLVPPFNFNIKPDLVSTLLKYGGKITNDIFTISFSSSFWPRDEVGKMESKFEACSEALAFVQKAGFVWKQKPNYYIHPK